jgi:uncharacterized protein YdhG (YjbR/CyaY superfamily)
MERSNANDVEAYISQHEPEVQPILQSIRSIVKTLVPGAIEMISYGIPTFKLDKKPLVYFAAFKSHLSLFPAISKDDAFEKMFGKYRSGKGTIRFSIDQPLPVTLVKKFVMFRLQEHERQMTDKKQVRTRVKKSNAPQTITAANTTGKTNNRGDLPAKLSAPARRALANKGIRHLVQLAQFSESDMLELHGVGKSSIPLLRNALAEKGLAFVT